MSFKKKQFKLDTLSFFCSFIDQFLFFNAELCTVFTKIFIFQGAKRTILYSESGTAYVKCSLILESGTNTDGGTNFFIFFNLRERLDFQIQHATQSTLDC